MKRTIALMLALAITAIGGTSIALSRSEGAEDRKTLVRELVETREMIEAKKSYFEGVRETLEEAEVAAAAAREILESEPPSIQLPPAPAPAPVSAGAISDAAFADLLRAAGFPESVIPAMISIGHRESGLCPTAVYGYGCAGAGHAYAGGPACGLLQLYPCPGPQALDPATNVRYAYQKYAASGLAPWGM